MYALYKSHTWKKFGSSDRVQNADDQSECIIFELIISLKQNDEKA